MRVTFNGGQTAKAEVVGTDAGYDLAVVKVERRPASGRSAGQLRVRAGG